MSDNSQAPTFTDPVCHMTVEPNAEHACDYEGSTYYFCCARCEAAFRTEPERYLEQ